MPCSHCSRAVTQLHLSFCQPQVAEVSAQGSHSQHGQKPFINKILFLRSHACNQCTITSCDLCFISIDEMFSYFARFRSWFLLLSLSSECSCFQPKELFKEYMGTVAEILLFSPCKHLETDLKGVEWHPLWEIYPCVHSVRGPVSEPAGTRRAWSCCSKHLTPLQPWLPVESQ